MLRSKVTSSVRKN